MSLLLTFMELDKLYESTLSRQDLINNIKASGRQYNFDTKTTDQLFRIWERIQKEEREAAGWRDYYSMLNDEPEATCTICNTVLSDGGLCPVCDDGEEHLCE